MPKLRSLRRPLSFYLFSRILISPSAHPSLVSSQSVSAPTSWPTASATRSTQNKNGDDSAIIISTIDGVIYTLDAHNGNLRGMVQSGGSLYSNSRQTSNNHDVESWKPGLDGTLYRYAGTDKMEQLPMTIRDIIDHGPISTCVDGMDGGSEICGLVMGQSSSKLIALDPLRGTVEWMHGTNSNFNAKTGETKTVLLQREDHNVKHVDAQNGKVAWNLHLGSIRALEIPKKRTRSRTTNGLFEIKSGVIEGGKKDNLGPGGDSDRPLIFQKTFPSIAFGNDGLTLFSIDELQNILWVRKFESIISSVYGVGGDTNWVELKVVDFTNAGGGSDNTEKHGNGKDTPFPFRVLGHEDGVGSAGGMDEGNWNQMGTAITASGDSHGGMDEEKWNQITTTISASGDSQPWPYLSKPLTPLPPWRVHSSENSLINKYPLSSLSLNPSKHDVCEQEDQPESLPAPASLEQDHDELNFGTKEDLSFIYDIINKRGQKISYKTEDGLFLTWKMVTLLLACVLSGAAGGRLVYVRKKRRWFLQSSPTAAPENSKDLGDKSQIQVTTRQDFIIAENERVPALNLESAHDVNSSTKTILSSATPLKKSANFPDDVLSKESRLPNEDTSSSKDADSVLLNAKHMSPSVEGVSNVNGIPLIRYSRYKSEFVEVDQLGKGGFGTVFKCMNVLDGREYAVKKVLIKSYSDSKGTSKKLERVLREVKNLALLHHDNIVRYYTAWLEVETDENLDAPSTNEATLSKAFSTELLVGSEKFDDQSSWQVSHQASSNGQVNHLLSALGQRSNATGNPLGYWNEFSTASMKFDDSSQCSRSQSAKLVRNGLSSSSLKSEDLGFTFDRGHSTNTSSKQLFRNGSLSTIQDSKPINCDDSNSSSSSENLSSMNSSRGGSDSNWSINDDESTPNVDGVKPVSSSSSTFSKKVIKEEPTTQKYTLYIQMQLSQKTLLDYFNARDEDGDGDDDFVIPPSVRIFCHIARGVKHVHEKGLIHRDLKPSNCFMDDSDLVKIGDFGLSRESGSANEEEVDITANYGKDNTAGVGTSSYASPEQMERSDYDASSDVYSLGILLFELCYPMRTGMERYKVFEGIRRRRSEFPRKWHSTVANQFPAIHELLVSMLSHKPCDRPTAAEVVTRVESLLSEHTVLSLDRSLRTENSVFVRVEAEDNEGALARTIKIIKESTVLIQILQYSLRAKDSKAIMEFALKVCCDERPEGSDRSKTLELVFQNLYSSGEITLVRQIQEASSPGRSAQQRALSM